MKNTIIPTLLILALFAVYSFGQARQKPAPKDCCCEHVQEILEVLKRIEKNGIKKANGSESAPPPEQFQGFIDPGDVTVPNFDDIPNIPNPRKKALPK